MHTVGFVGLGRMGSVMAANLAAAGHRVVAYLRQSKQCAALAAAGVHPVTTFDPLRYCDVIITMVPDDAALIDVVVGHRQGDGLISRLQPGAVHLSMSTISPGCSSKLAAEHARNRQRYVAAPVFGNPDAAKARELFIVVGGISEAIEYCRPLLDVLGQRTFVIGSDPAAANLAKLAGNVMSAATMEIMGEVLALACKRGLDPEALMNIFTSTMFDSRVHRIYGAKIVARSHAAGFALPLALKDVRLALAEADAAAVPMPSVGVVRERMLAGIARGYGHLDWSALGRIAAEEAGLPDEGKTP
jgi:3-hydroxyisobutyrate dehydrogenase-like beta-hydroxyacid dehydrogenase